MDLQGESCQACFEVVLRPKPRSLKQFRQPIEKPLGGRPTSLHENLQAFDQRRPAFFVLEYLLVIRKEHADEPYDQIDAQ